MEMEMISGYGKKSHGKLDGNQDRTQFTEAKQTRKQAETTNHAGGVEESGRRTNDMAMVRDGWTG